MENLQAVAALLRKQLAEIEAKMIELAPKPPPVSVFDLHKEVLNISNTRQWKDFINNGVVDNITLILDQCYEFYVDFINEELPGKKPVDIIGEFGSEKWQKFQFEVIKTLISPSDMDEDFEDTANGCDEIASEAGIDVIKATA